MYDRRVENTVLTFGHTGRLYENSFVFYDHQTNSQWVHVTGRAETGLYKGTKLRFIPSTVTSWKQWKTLYPDTKVLPGSGRGGFMGTYRGFYHQDKLGLVVSHFRQAKLYSFESLIKETVINDTFDDEPIVITFNKARRTATAWKRNVKGKILTFQPEYDPKKGFIITDKESGSRWDPISGVATGGYYEATELSPLTHNPILVDRFKAHYPEGEIYEK